MTFGQRRNDKSHENMVKSVEQIEKEIVAIAQATTELRAAFERAYSKYLTALGKSVRQQLILAVYYICTKAYPQSFLGMSLKQQQQIQEDIKKIADEAAKHLQLLSVIEPEREVIEPTEKSSQEASEKLAGAISANNALEIKLAHGITLGNTSGKVTNPQELWNWQEKVESLIIEILEFTSRRANLGLKQLGIFPKMVGDMLIEAAKEVANHTDNINRQGGIALVGEALGTPSQPNILNLTVEIPKDPEAVMTKGHIIKEEKPFNIITIHLRLHEIEFADSAVMAYRQEIRDCVSRLTVLKRDYQRKEQNLIVAKAEAAWRAIWFDE
ncbi:hypothetical protein [[Phormidium] sp. ETS-05]|uniref:hypothetical protein n=1 Tax=[Phormidium] sp. ETS-05 TaxID=222819 RepID=UPI0018EEF003|nr:hypothetical protein [[Phormidium] sp. ETS-05]